MLCTRVRTKIAGLQSISQLCLQFVRAMDGSIEEEELTAQRDAAVALFKGIKEKLRLQAEEYEARTEATEMARIEAEIELERLLSEENGSAMTARGQVRRVTQGWLIGVVLGWSSGLVVGCLFSPVLGFMLVLPFVSAGIIGGLIYAQIREKIGSLRRETHRGSADKEEFLRQLQGRSDPSLTAPSQGLDSTTMPSRSFLRRVATTAAQAVLRSALDVTMSAVSSVLGVGMGAAGAALRGGGGGGEGGRRGRGGVGTET